MTAASLRRLAPAALVALGLLLGTACSGDGGEVRTAGPPAATTADLGAYAPVSDVASVAAVARDVADITALLEADRLEVGAVERIYAEGANAVEEDGSVRTLRSFAVVGRDEPIWNDYEAFYEDPSWLDTFVSQALAGTGPFAGASDDVRRQAIQKGIQDGVMVASVMHELVSAEQLVAAGETDPADGAPRDVDEAWAFYHGADPSGAPFQTAAGRGADFGTGDAVNRAVLAQMTAAQAAAAAGDARALKAADDEIVRQILIVHIQSALEYAAEAEVALAEGDEPAARAEQAAGLALFRVIAPLVARVDEPAARMALDAFDITAGPSRGMGEAVARALGGTYAALGIRPAEIGTYKG